MNETAAKVKVELQCSRVVQTTDGQGRPTGSYLSQDQGSIVEMDAAEAQRHIDRGLARPFTAERQRERQRERDGAQR
jgi:hypothetical protein